MCEVLRNDHLSAWSTLNSMGRLYVCLAEGIFILFCKKAFMVSISFRICILTLANRAGLLKLTKSLVNISLKFQKVISEIHQYILLKKCLLFFVTFFAFLT